ncbi:pleiotropic regulator 1 [Ischnura elegans]|uniref:pleiotropic regulator 1 n=1 Tax=Ischnura elegans TaxID=197161 RepID=UPI001ED8B57F|nr:pleiotropic regulator 1 [Ischnura elegans]
MTEEVHRHSVHTLVFRSLKRTHDTFLSDHGMLPPIDEKSEKIKKEVKIRDAYGLVMEAVKRGNALRQGMNHLHNQLAIEHHQAQHHIQQQQKMLALTAPPGMQPVVPDPSIPGSYPPEAHLLPPGEGAPLPPLPVQTQLPPTTSSQIIQSTRVGSGQQALIPRRAPAMPRPKWHPPWKLFRVISGHLGWVRCVAVEPGNDWFATGSADRVIKIWDLGSGKLKLSLTGHISSVRGLAVSTRHPYLFSCGEDRQVKCWDLEYNKVIRHYHGHLSAVYALALHPSIDVLVTAGRDATARVWDMRTKANVHTLVGHTNTVASVVCQSGEPQVITGSHDCTIRLWDLAAGKSKATLTNHKKSVRAIVIHPSLYMFASASPDNIKQWRCPDGRFVQNLPGHNAIINCLAANQDGVLVSGGDNGTLHLWDWKTGYNFQRLQAPVQPGSMDSESGIFAMTFDQSSSRLITTEADKTIKIYKEDENATEETNPIHWRPEIIKRRKY